MPQTAASGAELSKPAELASARNGSGPALSRDKLIEIYRLMYLSRRTDDREIILKNQQKIFFQISGAGHEALLVAAGLSLRPGYDWFFPYYRDRALCLALGTTVEEQLLQAVGAATDPASGGRQMPSHWSSPKLHIVTPSSSTATQCLQAVGCAEAALYLAAHPEAAEPRHGRLPPVPRRRVPRRRSRLRLHRRRRHQPGRVLGGHQHRLQPQAPRPLRRRRQRLRHLRSRRGQYPRRQHLAPASPTSPTSTSPKSTAPIRSPACAAFEAAVAHCRAAQGPALVHGHVVRPYAHSLSDDDAPLPRRRASAGRSPPRPHRTISRCGCCAKASSTREAIERLEKQVDEEVRHAAERALQRRRCPPPSRPPSCAISIPRTSTPPRARLQTPTPSHRRTPATRTMADLINACLHDEMRRDPRIVVFGEDVADCTRDETLAPASRSKAKAASSSSPPACSASSAPTRVFNSALAEAAIVGRAIGMAVRGLKPVAEIQFFDYIWPAMHQLRNELSAHPLALQRWLRRARRHPRAHRRLSHRRRHLSLAVRREHLHPHARHPRRLSVQRARRATACSAPPSAATTPCSSSSTSASIAKPTAARPIPAPTTPSPSAKPTSCAPASTSPLITYGAIVPRALQAAQRAARESGIEAELLDLRTLNPYDWEAIADLRPQDQQSHRRPRRHAQLGLRRRNRRPHRRRALRLPRRPRPPRRRHGHLRRLPAHRSKTPSSPARRDLPGHRFPRKILTGHPRRIRVPRNSKLRPGKARERPLSPQRSGPNELSSLLSAPCTLYPVP